MTGRRSTACNKGSRRCKCKAISIRKIGVISLEKEFHVKSEASHSCMRTVNERPPCLSGTLSHRLVRRVALVLSQMEKEVMKSLNN